VEPLPSFKYHPDPVATGVVEASETPCLGCNRIRGWIYTGPVDSEKFHHLSGSLCPWCIADGTAAARFGAVLNDAGAMDGVSLEVRWEIESRTPGFIGWQQEQWLSCCGDGAAFLGLAGAKELRDQFPEAIVAVKNHLEQAYDFSGSDLEEFFAGLKKDDQPTAYVFRCLHCRKYLAYVDLT